MKSMIIHECSVISKLEKVVDSIFDIANDKTKDRLIALYTPIVVQYADICKDNNLIPLQDNTYGWLNFWEQVSKSIQFVANNRYLLEATENLNKLAETWDDEVADGSSVRSHVFFFCCIDDGSNDGTYTRMFYDVAPPDQRLVCIFLPSKKKYSSLDFYEVLHEVGHYIGRRIRTKRLEAFRISVAAELCNQVYQRLMQIALGETETHNIPANIEDNIYLSTWMRELSFDVRTCTINAYRTLADNLNTSYDAANDVMKKKISEITFFTNAQKAKAIRALDFGYFSFVIPTVMYALESILSIEKKSNWSFFSKEYISDQSSDFINENINAVFLDLLNEFNDTDNIPNWLQTCEQHYKESGADLFMIRLATLSAHEYIHFVLTSAYNVWRVQYDQKEDLSFQQFLSNGALYPKIIGVLYSVFKQECDKVIEGRWSYKQRCLKCYFPWNKNKKIKNALESGYAMIQKTLYEYRTAMFEQLSNDELDLLNIYNPIYRISEYMANVEDKFWQHTNANGDEINIDEKKQQYMMGLIAPFKYPKHWFAFVKFFIKKKANSLQ